MLIVCKHKRTKGSIVTIGDKTYHFKPKDATDPDSPHVCEVTEVAHIRRFVIGIKEAYERANPDDEIPPAPAVPNDQTIYNDSNTEQGETSKAKPVIIMNGDEEVNLSDMSLEDIAAFARNTFQINVHHKWKQETIIAKILEATRVEVD